MNAKPFFITLVRVVWFASVSLLRQWCQAVEWLQCWCDLIISFCVWWHILEFSSQNGMRWWSFVWSCFGIFGPRVMHRTSRSRQILTYCWSIFCSTDSVGSCNQQASTFVLILVWFVELSVSRCVSSLICCTNLVVSILLTLCLVFCRRRWEDCCLINSVYMAECKCEVVGFALDEFYFPIGCPLVYFMQLFLQVLYRIVSCRG